MGPDDIISTRREATDRLLARTRDAFLQRLGDAWEVAVGSHTTVYATGSCGRGDMGAASDLDPYAVRLEAPVDPADLDVARDAIAEALAAAAADVGLPELDGDGRYAHLVTAESLFANLGSPADDESGALTRRMLLLLESRPLVNPKGYRTLLDRTLAAYWKNADRHPNDYLPIVLVNDIVRYWRILLLNHESRLREKTVKIGFSASEEMAFRRYSSYKLRVPRCLSCFSALSYLLVLTAREPAHVAREDVVRMVGMTPIERLRLLRGYSITPLSTLDELENLYAGFLRRTDGGKTALTDELMSDPEAVRVVSRDGQDFTRHMFDLIQALGGGRTLHRAIVV